jgi:hypothetical protein
MIPEQFVETQMVKRVRLKYSSGSDDEVGYRKPPKSTQFKPGQSGYPQGRSKGSRNFKTDVRETLDMPVKMSKNGGVQNVSTQRANLMVLREKALKGDQRAIERLIRLAESLDDKPTANNNGLDASDRAILDAFVNKAIARSSAAAPDHAEGDSSGTSHPAVGESG